MKICEQCAGLGLCASKIQLFKSLGLEKIKHLSLTSVHKDFEKNELIFSEGQAINQIIIVRYGKVKTCMYDEDGKEYIGNIYLEGDIIGEDSIFIDKNYEMDGIAMEKTGICIIDEKVIKDIIYNDSAFSIKMIESLSNKLYLTQKQLEIASIKDSYKRLAAFLYHRSKLIDSDVIELNQETISSSISMTRETVSRKLSELEKNGYIELKAYKKIHIKNLPALHELSAL